MQSFINLGKCYYRGGTKNYAVTYGGGGRA
jgi:hypothetical protein